ncbi:snRNA-activating protein complex subunit 1 isoform X2 [Sceloporus undulatus]|uniref:snRNA-activating protein complex subunit 1 isoform X2 n=1 Tax=Sceloporus undulatus TaxID=8520 RepID=UPI001C4AECC8|nr:snRNA-activating protein complex subunit 1 isoform X2 [Sceloporus undulatus]
MSGWPGLRTDCEALLGRFQEAETVRFEEFAALWRQQRFHTVFYGKIRTPEQIKFTKEALALVWPYFLPPYTFQIRVGALYLLYGLYNTQLCKPKQKIRVALKDWAEVIKFQQELLDAQHYDAAYVFRKLRTDKAFYFTAMPKLLSFRTKKNMHDKTEMKSKFRDPTDRVAMVNPEEFLEETKNVHEHYQQMKCLISRDQSQPDRAINLIKDDFPTNFMNIFLEYEQWQKNKMESFLATTVEEGTAKRGHSSQESEGSERARALADIKSRSYSTVASASKSRRHRQVKLESSESGSDHGKKTSPRAKKVGQKLQPRRKNETLKTRAMLQPTGEQSIMSLSMPTIAEDDAEEEEEEEIDQYSDEDFIPTKMKRTC